MKKNFTIFILAFILFFNMSINLNVFAFSQPNISAPSGVLIDFETGKVVYDKNSNTQMYPASTTKIMTALLTLEKCDLKDIVIIDSKSPYTGGSRIYLNQGEKVTIEQLLYALLVESANDAAVALAIHISGSVENFASLMNDRAKEIGATNTHFTNPNGMPDPMHITTASDLALIAREAMKLPKFKEIVKTVRYEISPTNKQEETRYLKNSNRFLWGTGSRNKMQYNGKYTDIKYDIVDGIKTGYTVAAQQCLVSTAFLDGQRFISVVLKANGANIYSDSRSLLDYGFNNFKSIKLATINQKVKTVPIDSADTSSVNLIVKKDLSTLVLKDNSIDIDQSVSIFDNKLTLPINKGDILGELVFKDGEEEIGKVDLIADRNVTQSSLFSFLHTFNLSNSYNYLYFPLGIIVLFLIYRTLITIKRLRVRKLRRRRLKKYNRIKSYKE